LSPDTYIHLDSGGDFGKITAEVRPPLDNDVRWKIAHTGNGTYT